MRTLRVGWAEALDGVRLHPTRSIIALVIVTIACAVGIIVPGLTRSNEARVAWYLGQTAGNDVILRSRGTGDVLLGAADVDRLRHVPAVHRVVGGFSLPHISARSPLGGPGVPVIAATGDLGAAQLEFSTGGPWNPEHATRPVALVSEAVAAEAGIGRPTGDSVIYVAGRSYRVIGIFRQSSPLGWERSVVIPYAQARADFPTARIDFSSAMLEVATHDMPMVAALAPAMLYPADPLAIQGDYARGSEGLGELLSAELGATTLAGTALGGLITAALVGSMMTSSVRARTPEIGIRRSLGARSIDLVAQFVGEAAIIGVAGAGLGLAVGVGTIDAVAAATGGPAAIPPGLTEIVVAITVAATLLAGVAATIVAVRLDVVEALGRS